jgi:RNA polymerase sigma-70 factor (ECF subfamily)
VTDAFERLVREHAPFVMRVLLHLGVTRPRIDDASQEVFLIVLDKFAEFERRSSLRTWLYGICRNVARAERRRHRRSETPLEELPERVVQPAQEGELWIRRAHERLVQALETLDDDQRQVFILFEIEELPMEEIARISSTPLGTCYSRLYRARERVHAALRRGELAVGIGKQVAT